MKIKIFLTSIYIFLPVIVSAQTIQNFIISFNNLIATTIPVVIGIALVFFFWGLVKFIAKAGDEKERQTGKKLMIWGLIALFVMVSIWGIIAILQKDLGLDDQFPEDYWDWGGAMPA